MEPLPEERPVLVVDLGGQYAQLIARRVREARVYSELVSHRVSVDEIRRRNPAAIILSGGPASVYADGAPRLDPAIFELGVPTPVPVSVRSLSEWSRAIPKSISFTSP